MNKMKEFTSLIARKKREKTSTHSTTKERTISVRHFFALLHTLKVKPFAMLSNTQLEGVYPINIFNPVLSKIELYQTGRFVFLII